MLVSLSRSSYNLCSVYLKEHKYDYGIRLLERRTQRLLDMVEETVLLHI